MAAEESCVASLTSDKRETLTCALCLDVYRSPKLLPCSHTFCQKCLEDLSQRHPEGSFPCPACRKQIEIPADGASSFQANFYIDEEELEKARNVTTCSVHRNKQLKMFCLECDLLICTDCKINVHLHHKSQSLEDAQRHFEQLLTEDKVRLRQMKDHIGEKLPERRTNQEEFKRKKAAVENKIRHRHATLVAEADKYLKEALESLEEACCETEKALSEDLQTASGNIQTLNSIEQKVDRALQRGEGCGIVNTARDVRTGYGSQEHVEKMRVGPLQCVSRPVHLADIPADDAMFVSMKNFIGRGHQVTYAHKHDEVKVKVNEEADCGGDADSVVFCVCPGDRMWYVSFESSYKDKEPCWKKLSDKGEVISDEARKGPYSYKHRGADQFMHSSCQFSKTGSPRTHVKGADPDGTHYHLVTNCDSLYVGNVGFSKVISEEPFKTNVTNLFSINCGPHRAVDTNASRDLFAVVEEARTTDDGDRGRQVKLFRRFQRGPTATYQPPLAPCHPADVCFFQLAGQEVLLVADECNDCIHVVEVKDERLTFSRYLAPGCPLLIQPTALNIDPKGRLWVGCRGGRILTVETLPQAAAAATVAAADVGDAGGDAVATAGGQKLT